MKKIIYSIVAVIMSGGFSACTDILNTAPHDKISSGNMWTSESNVDQGVTGVYFSLKSPVQGSGIVGEDVKLGSYGFEAFGMTGQPNGDVNAVFSNGVTPLNTRFIYTWQWCYDGIHRANDAIAHIPGVPMNEAKKARLVAECKVLRAFFYERLNILFGNNGIGVPLYTVPVENRECNKGQSPESEIWAQIIRDLTDAINETNLPDNNIKGEGRVGKGFAYALRGRAYLITKEYGKAVADFAKVGDCGYKLFPDYKALFKQANERCEEMVFSVQYIEEELGFGSSIQKYFAAFQQGSKDSRGCWAIIQPTPAVVNLYEVVVDANTVKPFSWTDYIPEWSALSAQNTTYRKVFFARDSLVAGKPIHTTISDAIKSMLNTLPASVQSYYQPAGNEARLKAAYANRDPRLGLNVVTPYSDFKGVNSTSSEEGMYTYRWPVAGNTYFNQITSDRFLNPNLPASYNPTGTTSALNQFKYIYRKFVGEGQEFSYRTNNPIDEPILRYADVLLMWAEALVEQDDLTGAMAKVKLVRDRVGIPTMASSFANQSGARNYVRDERRREFLGEGVNFFDEMRWRTIKETKFAEDHPQPCWGGVDALGSAVYQWPGDYWYTWPVPNEEIEKNHNLTKTPGWPY